MKLDVECTWNNQKNKAKQSIRFDFLPKSIFCMPNEKILLLQQLSQNAAQTGPSALDEMKSFKEQYSKSLYAAFIYYQTLDFFEYFDEALEMFKELQRCFPEEVLTKCAIAIQMIKKKEHEEFAALFKNIQVLKGAFPKRRMFFFEEALFFHNLWAQHFDAIGDQLQSEKHKKFVLLILNTFQTFSLAQP